MTDNFLAHVLLHALRGANRVGHGNQHNGALDLPRRIQTLQQRTQVVSRQHARQLFCMEAGLDVHLRARARLAEMTACQRFVYAQAGR